MGGFFGVVSKSDCVADLFYGTDYHSHLGTRRGGLAVHDGAGCARFIHDITNAQFRSKFEFDVLKLKGRMGIGVISDTEDQPLIIGSHLGNYAIVTVGRIANADELVKKAYGLRSAHFSEMSGAEVNPTELVALYINQGATFAEGIEIAQNAIEGSCSMLLLTDKGFTRPAINWDALRSSSVARTGPTQPRWKAALSPTWIMKPCATWGRAKLFG